MQVQLFGSRLSPFVEKVVRAPALKQVLFTLIDVKSPRDFKRWNPVAGKMPVLDVDGERTFDSTFILQARRLGPGRSCLLRRSAPALSRGLVRRVTLLVRDGAALVGGQRRRHGRAGDRQYAHPIAPPTARRDDLSPSR